MPSDLSARTAGGGPWDSIQVEEETVKGAGGARGGAGGVRGGTGGAGGRATGAAAAFCWGQGQTCERGRWVGVWLGVGVGAQLAHQKHHLRPHCYIQVGSHPPAPATALTSAQEGAGTPIAVTCGGHSQRLSRRLLHQCYAPLYVVDNITRYPKRGW